MAPAHQPMQLVRASTGASVASKTVHGMQMTLPYQILADVPMVALHGIISRPLPGADAVLLFHGGDPSNAVAIGVNDPRYHLPDLPDGCVGLAHHLGAHILFFGDRIEIEGNAAPLIIRHASKVRIEGDLEVTGEITARADGDAIHLSTHRHTGIQRGPAASDGPQPGS